MNKETLIWARNQIVKALSEEKEMTVDLLELIINLNTLLEPENYEKDIQILKEHHNKAK